ncbi:MAG: npdA [Acidimicrobiia bacterium]|nr:npdA [Acidimicrobiia bacterium]
MAEADRITVLAGAGISTDSGISDFRGPNGLWTKNPEAEKMATLQYYVADPELRKRAWRSRLDNPMWHAQPNAGHLAIAELERRGKLVAVITQNVDGLHQAAGNTEARVIEVHGTVREVNCLLCGDRFPMEEMLPRLEAGDDDPHCEHCGGLLKSATISFGQNLVPEVIEAAFEAAVNCDLFVAVGTTLQVYPVAQCLPEAKAAGARTVIVNAEPTGMDDLADVVLPGSIGELLPALFL